MRLPKIVIAPILCLSLGLLVGCGQAPAQDDAATQDEAPAAEATEPEAEPEPEPAMSNWTENSFYERPISEIASDLELLGFEMSGENSYTDTDALGDVVYYFLSFRGTPEDNPLEGSDKTVGVDFTIENPALKEGETEYTLENLDEGTIPTGFSIGFYLPEDDPSEYEALATKLADAVGLGAFTDSYVGDAFGTGRVIGNFDYADTYKGVECTSMLLISPTMDDYVSSLPNPDMPLLISYGPYVSERA